MLDDATRYQLLRILEAHPDLSQRELAEQVGISLGKANYLLKALVGKGWVKIQNFRNNNNKSVYLYQLTPTGLSEKVRVTQRFLARKLQEHQQIEAEIETLRREVLQQGAPE